MKKTTLLLVLLVFFIPNTYAQNQAVTSVGDIVQLVLPAAALASCYIWKDTKETVWHKKPAIQFLASYTAGLILQQSLKRIVLKPRPDGSDNYSFPSGHTTSAFSGAACIERRYGWKYGIPAYAMASFVGYSRIQAKKHDGWDVLGGAAIGIGTAYLFTTPYTKKPIDLTFNKSGKEFVVGLNYTF